MFWNNFIKLCAQNNVKPNNVTKQLGLSTATATDWKKGRIPRDVTLHKLADYFGVSVDYLLRTDEPSSPTVRGNAIILDASKTRSIPVYESVSAGFGALAHNYVTEYIPMYINSDEEARETICIKVTGDSMSPEIENGDIIQVHKQPSVDSGSVAVVLLDGEEALVKQLIYDEDHIELHSFNTEYAPLCFAGAELMRIRVLGLVKNTLKKTHTHRIGSTLSSAISELSEDLSPDEQTEVEQFIKYLKSKRTEK